MQASVNTELSLLNREAQPSSLFSEETIVAQKRSGATVRMLITVQSTVAIYTGPLLRRAQVTSQRSQTRAVPL